jgi:hypothetical protein
LGLQIACGTEGLNKIIIEDGRHYWQEQDEFDWSIIQRIRIEIILSMSQMNLIVEGLSYPTQTLFDHLLKSMTDHKTNCQYFMIDHPLASALLVSLSY